MSIFSSQVTGYLLFPPESSSHQKSPVLYFTLHISPNIPHQPIRKINHIIRRRTNRVIQLRQVYRSAIILPGCIVSIPILHIRLLEARPVRCAFCSVSDHLEDRASRVGGVKGCTVKSLHDARVDDTIEFVANVDIASRFLHAI